MEVHVHDIVETKKPHPCGSVQWEILRIGMDIRMICCKCGREAFLPRIKVEKNIRKILISSRKENK